MSQESVTKTEYAYQTLRQDILEARLAPDTPLRLVAIREVYGIGWTPLREALSRLEAEHMVLSTANKGYVVAPVSIAELADLTKSKGLVELQLLREAIEFGDQAWEASIVAAHYRLSREVSPLEVGIDPQTYMAWTGFRDAFQFALLAANHSLWLSRFYLQVRDHIRRHERALHISIPPLQPEAFFATLKASPALRLSYSLAPHTALMEAVINRQFEQAARLMGEYNDLTVLAYKEMGYGEDILVTL